MPSPEHLGLDLELTRDGHLTAIGATLGDATFQRKVGGAADAANALRDLDTFAAGATLVYGHNVCHHDLRWLHEQAPDLALLRKPVVDSLFVSTIAFAEHPYHALLKDYKPVREARNDPVADARISARLLDDASERLRDLHRTNPAFPRVISSLGTLAMRRLGEPAARGFDAFLGALTEPAADVDAELRAFLLPRACRTAVDALLGQGVAALGDTLLPLLFAIGWLRVAATHDTTSPSVPMPWVRQRWPATTGLLHRLRDVPCHDPACRWCPAIHEPRRQLKRWFDYDDFRAEPTLPDHRPAQRAIVDAGFADQPLLALLPTGGGKSLCFQLPAIQRYLRRGCLTVVISPLQSLMHDQVDNFAAKTGVTCAVAITGRLTPPERRAALDAVRSGQAGIVYVAPEQLRNRTFAKVLALREVGAWVFDEAHCLSKWGHDFRPDYLYAARFVREFGEQHRIATAPIVCVTATAKPEVRDEIVAHFRAELGQELQVFDGHAARQNLELRVETVTTAAKARRMHELVAAELAVTTTGSVLVYTATRRTAERAAALLMLAGIAAEPFHAGLEVPRKKDVQERFLRGDLRVVCATNAFGMGIDKPDIRLVVHHDVPGSLENYVQEVGRAGRDGLPARAVLLYAEDDIETQFRLAAGSELHLRDLQAILRRIRHLARGPVDGVREAICTPGEILRDDELAERIDPGDRSAPTRILTAIAWLERGKFLRRDENATTVFQGRPLVPDLDTARQRIAALQLPANVAAAWLAVLTRLIQADADEGFSTDDFLGLPEVIGLVGVVDAANAGRSVLRLLLAMQKARLLSEGVLMTAFVRVGIKSPSTERLQTAARVEATLLDVLREHEPDPDDHRHYPLRLPSLNQELVNRELPATPELVRSLLAAMSDRAAHASQRAPGLRIRFTSREHCLAHVQGSWDQIAATSRRRHALAHVCLQTMLDRLPADQTRGSALLVEFSLEQLLAAMQQDLELRSQPAPDPAVEIEYALLFLHRIGAIVLHKGLAVFRQAMVLRVPGAGQGRKFQKDDFAPLGLHQEQRTVQIHVMREFAEQMVRDAAKGLRLLDDYFRLPEERFLGVWFPRRREELDRSTSPQSWQRIVHDLSADQRRIVEAGDNESLLVLAGPGSGKTRVVVHRCAFLLRVRRVPARAILVLCFNRSAALELRRRLHELVGDDARGVLVQTYHGMAARLAGRSPADLLDRGGNQDLVFRELLELAIAQLTAGTGGDDDGDDLRDRLLAGFRHILVDEYQDIDEDQYRLVSAIAGRTLDDERKLTVLAVGDDDQNIYHWRGSNVAFLRRFESDYGATRLPLVENYRSTAHVIAAANALIARNRDRLKADTPIRIDERRAAAPPGGTFGALDRLTQGRVHVLMLADAAHQAQAVVAELQRLAACSPDFAFAGCAVLSPRHRLLDGVRTALEAVGIPFRQRIDSARSYSLFRLREVQEFLADVEASGTEPVDAATLHASLDRLRRRRPREPALRLVEQLTTGFLDEHGEPAARHLLREFAGDLLAEQRRERTLGDGVLLGTVHGSKGEEHDHVLLLDGGWQPRADDDPDDLRRLYYVGMTRARRTLALLQVPDGAPWLPELQGPWLLRTRVAATPGLDLLDLQYELLSQGDLWLAFAGRDAEHERIAAATDSMATGDELRMQATGSRLFLTTMAGQRIGALSEDASTHWRPRLPNVRSVRVAALLVRKAADESPEYRDGLRRPSWLLVIPEIACVK